MTGKLETHTLTTFFFFFQIWLLLEKMMSVDPMQLSDQPRGKDNLFFSLLVQEFTCSLPESIDCHKVVTAIEKSLCVCKCTAGAYIFAFEMFSLLNVS